METITSLFAFERFIDLLDVSREYRAEIMVLVDVVNCIGLLYVAAITTRQFGWGGRRQRMQLFHRAGTIVLAIIFGWHAEDIAVTPGGHGLNGINIWLHITVMIVMAISALRMSRMNNARDALSVLTCTRTSCLIRVPKNGDYLAGPLSAQTGPAYWKTKADEAKKLAMDRTTDPRVREALLQISQGFDGIAESI